MMNKQDIIRAWKDELFRDALEEGAAPQNPAGAIELTEEDLTAVAGGDTPSDDFQCPPPPPRPFTYNCTSHPTQGGCAG